MNASIDWGLVVRLLCRRPFETTRCLIKSFIGIYTLKWLIYSGLEAIYNEINITLLNLSIVHITRLDNKTKFFYSSSICQKKIDHIYHIHVNYSQYRMVTSGEWKDMINFAHENNTACKTRVACLHTCPAFLRSHVWSWPTHSRWATNTYIIDHKLSLTCTFPCVRLFALLYK